MSGRRERLISRILNILAAGMVGGLFAALVGIGVQRAADPKDVLSLAGAAFGAVVAIWGALFVENRKRAAERLHRVKGLLDAVEFQLSGLQMIAEGAIPRDGLADIMVRGQRNLEKLRDRIDGLPHLAMMKLDILEEEFAKRAPSLRLEDPPAVRRAGEVHDQNVIRDVCVLIDKLVSVREALGGEPSGAEIGAKAAATSLRGNIA